MPNRTTAEVHHRCGKWSEGYALTHKAFASTIVPVFFESREWSSPSSSALAEERVAELPDEMRIPLPPSVAGSEYGEDVEGPSAAVPTEEPEVAMEQPRLDEEAPPYPSMDAIGMDTSDPVSKIADPRDPPLLEEPAPDATDRTAPSPMEGLIQSIETEAHHTRRFVFLQSHVQELIRHCGISGRLIPRQSHLYRLMLSCFKADNSTTFASLYTQSVRMRDSCTYSHKLVEPHVGSQSPLQPLLGPSASWIHILPAVVQKGVLQLLHRIRTDSGFLATRMANLSSSQLNKLVHPHRRSAGSDSILQTSGVFKYAQGTLPQKLSKAKDDPTSQVGLQRDPLLLLVHGIFDTSSGPTSQESRRQRNVWSTTCARVIEAAKPGSDEVCTAILDAFGNMYPWPMKAQLELFLMELMQSGAFLLDPAVIQTVDFTKPEGRPTGKDPTASEFFAGALRTLTALLTDSSTPGIPQGVLELIRAILRKVESPDRKAKAKKFFVRWYCTSFISNILKYPETIGTMMTSHISDGVRKKIFHELAMRLQTSVLDALAPWKPSFSGTPPIEEGITKLLHLFDSLSSEELSSIPNEPRIHQESQLKYLMLSPNDVLTIIAALYPEEHAPITSKGFPEDAFISTASSVTGSSTLTSGSEEPRTGTASSTAASISGTSMTSNGSSNRMLVANLFDVPKVDAPDADVSASTGVTSESPKVEECAIPTLVLALARIANLREPSTIETNPSDERLSVIYLQDDGDGLSCRPDHFDKDLVEVNASLRRILKSELAIHPLREDDLMVLVESLVRVSRETPGGFYHRNASWALENDLETRFRGLLVHFESQYDFRSAHFWWKSLQVLLKLAPETRYFLFQSIASLCQTRIDFCGRAIKYYETWLLQLQRRQEAQGAILQSLATQTSKLRDKLWYLAGVRHSSNFSDALNVTRALKSMSKSSPPKQTGMAAWARQRLRSTIGSDRAQLQTLEVLAAPKDHGGPAKLSDAQAELVSRWLTRRSVENFCKGEERIHRFCLEIQKCVDKLVGETMLESPVLWSSNLYQHEKRQYGVGHGQPSIQPVREHHYWGRDTSFSPVSPSVASSPYPIYQSFGSPQNTRFDANSSIEDPGIGLPGDFPYGGFAGQNRSRSSSQYNGQELSTSSYQPWTLPPSPISPMPMPTMQSQGQPTSIQKPEFLKHMKELVTSLLLSELASDLWNGGSETDRWIGDNQSLQSSTEKLPVNGLQSTVTHLASLPEAELGSEVPQLSGTVPTDVLHDAGLENLPTVDTANPLGITDSRYPFSFEDAYKRLFSKFRLSSNPYEKLETLYELTTLIMVSQEPEPQEEHATEAAFQTGDFSILLNPKSPGLRPLGIPRTRLTRLEEVIANCEERRLNSMRPVSAAGYPPAFPDWTYSILHAGHTSPNITPTLRKILKDSSFRPHALFRDLQFIAAFVPSSILDNTPQGTAFWTVGLAAITLKSDLTKEMTRRANQIVAYHYDHQPKRDHTDSVEPRRKSLVGSDEDISSPVDDPTLKGTTLADAAKLYTLAALEGDPTAARELALFHLTHPELVQRVTLPLSRPGEVFKSASASTGSDRIGRGSKDGSSRGGLDPMTFAVAFHWMEVAANAGDRDAKAFLMENGDLGRGW
ncbi:hypothetical protein MMC30_005143 [Trapelia coarctata]|nr:hypothetical protein [Trapelia coarctata]